MIEYRLKEVFDPFYEAPIESWKRFADLCEEVSFKKNQKIKEENTVEKYGYFLLVGAVGAFVWKKNNYACLEIYLENSFFADDLSLTTGQASPLELMALENSSLLRLSKANIETLQKTPIGSRLFMVGEQQDNAKKQQHQMDLMTKTAEERYLALLTEKPEILTRIPQKHIASLLGITTQSLSRIRRKISQQDLLP